MSQDQIYKFLEKHKDTDRWWTAREISEELQVQESVAIINLRKLRKSRTVLFKKNDAWVPGIKPYYYHFRGGLRIQ